MAQYNKDKKLSCRQTKGPNGYCSLWTHPDLPFQALADLVGNKIIIYRVKTLGDKIEFVVIDDQRISTTIRGSKAKWMLIPALLKIMGADDTLP